MAIPDFQSVMRPVLVTVQNGVPLPLNELRERVMVENNLGVSVKQVYEVKQLDSDYFAEE